MKPKTKREKLLVELAPKLPPLTEKQMEYPKEHIFKKKGFYWKKGLVWCQCCGKEYPVMKSLLEVSLDVGGEVCEWCGNEIHMEHAGRGTSKHNNEVAWYSVITTFKGWQVVRAFEAERSNTRGKETVYSCREVFQIWVDEKGKETILTKHYTRSPFHLSWDYSSQYGIGHHNGGCGGGYYQMTDLFDVTGFYFYPRTTVLPIIKRNNMIFYGIGCKLDGILAETEKTTSSTQSRLRTVTITRWRTRPCGMTCWMRWTTWVSRPITHTMFAPKI